jgi:hypothetical protein
LSEVGIILDDRREAPSAADLEALITAISLRDLIEVRERCLRFRLHLDIDSMAGLLVRDLPFLISELEYLQAAAEIKDKSIDALRDEHNSLDLASRALQAALQQEQTRLESLQSLLRQTSLYEAQATRALTIAAGALEVAQRRDPLKIYADALGLVDSVLNRDSGDLGANESDSWRDALERP